MRKTSRGATVFLTSLEIKVLRWIANPPQRSIDAALYAETIWALIRAGLVHLRGTLKEAHLTISSEGAYWLETYGDDSKADTIPAPPLPEGA